MGLTNNQPHAIIIIETREGKDKMEKVITRLMLSALLVFLGYGLVMGAIEVSEKIEETTVVETYTVGMEVTGKDIVQYHGNADKQYLIAACGSGESAVIATNEQMFASLRMGEIVEVEITVIENNQKKYEIKG